VKKGQPSSPMQLKIGVAGDRRLTENVILEMRAAAERIGLDISNIEVVGQAPSGRKTRKPASPRKPRAGA
jgi:hypothetical protein